MSKYGNLSGPYFPAFGVNTRDTKYLSAFSPNVGKYGPEKTPYLDTFHAVVAGLNLQPLFNAVQCFGIQRFFLPQGKTLIGK